ncbi:MAG: glycosyltransferase [Candidatus Uhrbacteria bacterium]
MAKPLVTHVLWTLGRGGAERMVLDLVKHLPEAGFDAEVLAAGGAGDLLAEYEAAGVRVIVNTKPHSRVNAVSFLRGAIRKRRPAIWHTHLTPVWGGLAAKTTFVSPWIATAHGIEPDLSLSARLARRAAYRSANHVVCVSDSVRQAIHHLYKVPATQTSVISPGIDLDRFPARGTQLASDIPKLVTVSRLSPEKGLDTLLRALSELLRPWHLTIVGDGPERIALHRLAEMLGILPRVKFVGAVSDPSPYLRAADVFCMPSHHEGQGMALLEAAASYVPCIASDLPALREAFGDDGVVFVPSKDVHAWRLGIERVLNRYPEALLRGDIAAKVVQERYSLEGMVAKHAQLYRRFLRAPL